MSSFSQKTEVVANFLIITAAVLLIGFVVQRTIFSGRGATSQRAGLQPAVGSQAKLPQRSLVPGSKTLILALQTGCHFCNESAPFYRRLVDSLENKNIRVVAVLPNSLEESKSHLEKLGLKDLEVQSSSLESIQVSGTPTLILTNENGEITNYWLGKLTSEKEVEVMNKLNS